MKIVIFIISIISGLTIAGAPLEIGNKAPEIKVEKWVKGGPVSLGGGKGDNVYIVEFWATWCSPCRKSIPHLSKVQKKYKDNGLIVVGITKEAFPTVEAFVKDQKEMNYNIGIDPTGATYSSYMDGVLGIPYAFIINKEGVIVWSGHPLEMDGVLEEVIGGTFDLALTKQVTDLRKKLDHAIQTQDMEASLKIAQQILILKPEHNMAMNIVLYIFQQKKHEKDALSFLNHLLQLHPGNSRPYIEKLQLLSKMGDTDGVKSTAVQYIEQFSDNASKLNSISLVLLDFSFGFQPLKEALDAAEKSVAVTPPSDKMLLATHIDTLARCYYAVGRLDKAISAQERAIELIRGSDDETMFTKKLIFYQEVLKLAKTIK